MLVFRKKDDMEVRLQFLFVIILICILRGILTEIVGCGVNSTSRQNLNLCADL